MGPLIYLVIILGSATMVTPRKVHEGVCTVCKLIIKKGEARIINSLTGQKKNLSSLLNTYGGIDIVEGVMCRKCERRLIALDASVLEFKKMCQTDLHMLNSKRGLTDITNTQENKKRNSSKKLFSVTEQSEEKDSYSNFSVDEGFVSVSQSDSSSSVYNIGFKTPVLIRKKEVTTSTPIKCLSSPVTITTLSPIPASDNTCTNTTSCIVNNDHAYTCSKENSKKTPVHKAKLREQNDSNVLGEYIKKSEVDDFMTDNEFSDILGQLPQRSRQNFISCLLKHDHIKAAIEDTLLAGVAKSCDFLKNRKHGKLSVLMRKDWVALKNFNWGMILEELKTENPFLLRTFLSVLVPDSLNEEQKSRKAAENLPRLGMAYAILSQGRNSSLSRVQRVISTVLFDHICDQKIFDRLQPLGVCLSYNGGLQLLDTFAGHFNSDVIDSLKSGHRIRLVGDNINWKTGVHDERKEHLGKMHHAFGSAVIVQNTSFNHLSCVKPQVPVRHLETGIFLPSEQECEILLKDFATTLMRTAARHIPYFEQFLNVLPSNLWGEPPDGLSMKNKVIPLPVLHYNEQKYDEVVQIMDYYEDFLDKCYTEAGLDISCEQVHIGGDQLTRDRFSGAKRLRAGGLNPSERLEHLSPITFEMFHLLMNYVQLIFKQLFKDSSIAEIATMKCEETRILRSSVNPNVNEHYGADRDFIVSYVDCYIVEAVMHHFGMEDALSVPTRHQPPSAWKSKSEKQTWLLQEFGNIVKSYVWAKEDKSKLTDEGNVEVEGVVVPVKLGNGNTIQLMVKRRPTEPDMIQRYSHLVLELGLQFKSMLGLCNSPNRNRGLALLKTAMIHFKANNNLSKYASEIMRLLVHQYCVLSEKEASEEFYGMFVNTRGKPDSHIPCDLQMEYVVKEVKSNIKHMFSNKTDKNITTRTSALPVIKDISKMYDSVTGVITRCKKHSSAESLHDEKEMVKDIHQLNPFECQPGRKHTSFPRVPNQMSNLLDVKHFQTWIDCVKYKYATDLGN